MLSLNSFRTEKQLLTPLEIQLRAKAVACFNVKCLPSEVFFLTVQTRITQLSSNQQQWPSRPCCSLYLFYSVVKFSTTPWIIMQQEMLLSNMYDMNIKMQQEMELSNVYDMNSNSKEKGEQLWHFHQSNEQGFCTCHHAEIFILHVVN